MIKQERFLGVQQEQRLLLSFSMQQAIQVLQMSVLELSESIHQEIAENPYLEYSIKRSRQFSRSAFDLESKSTPSLFEYLMQQARLCSFNEEELRIAEHLIGCLDERGFLNPRDVFSYMEKVLKTIQSFDPPGIAARSLQESLLIQLEHKGMGASFGFLVVKEHYEDLLHNRLHLIAKKTKSTISEIKAKIEEEIAPLDLRPGAPFFDLPCSSVKPDICLFYEEGKWNFEINEEDFPGFQIKKEEWHDPYYLQKAKGLSKAIKNRKKTLLAMSAVLVKKQGNYLSGDSDYLEPMTMQEIADMMSIHISTVARAVNQKYLFCPRGTLALRSLFTYDLGNATSNETAKQLLLHLIEKENKKQPLSDEALALKVSASGIPLARRTITKYRKQHKIPSARLRRKW